MPTIVQVKVNTPGTTTRGNSNMIQLTGFDYTNNRGFKKLFFEEKQQGGRTANAEVSDTLSKDDWVEITMDDTQYNNVTNIRKISEPAGAVVPDSTQGKPSGGGGGNPSGGSPAGRGTSDKMSKADWAEKDRKKETSVARSVAIKSAAVLFSGKGATKAIVDSLEKLAYRLEAYLMKGDFDADLAAEPEPIAAPPANTSTPIDSGGSPEGAGGSPGPEDDDIPF
jgi:hypothetical protein